MIDEIMRLAEQMKQELMWYEYYINVRTRFGEDRAAIHKQAMDDLIEKIKETVNGNR